MTKIMLVEDDKSLREIYGVRLLAEGYDIVSAGDGEEALAMAIKERPQLIISDVMMPKISGFDLLDILRSTTETKNIRVIMMTALSSEDQRLRGEQLGADRYLVKSQVGIEDVVRVVHEILEDAPTTAPAPAAAVPPPAPAAVPVPTMPPSVAPAPTPQPVTTPAPPPAPVAPVPVLPVPPVAVPPMPAAPGSNPLSIPTGTASVAKPPQARAKVITPLNDPTTSPIDINDLLDKEIAKEAGLNLNAAPSIPMPQTAPAPAPPVDAMPTMLPPSELPTDKLPNISVDTSGTISTMPSPIPTIPAPTPTADAALPQPTIVPPQPPVGA